VSDRAQKLSFGEKAGYSAADAAANFVFMSMLLFQTNFYTDVFGLTAGAAATILLLARLWDAVADPIVGVLSDRTQTRWGKFRPWILFTAAPWSVLMVFAYTTPSHWSGSALVAYAAVTNVLLMSIYSMNNMPYAALGGVMTADVTERAKLNSFRFVAVNVAQFIVSSFTLPLVAKFSADSSRQHGWQMAMTLWAVVCFCLFLVTFATTKERIQPPPQQKSDVRRDVASLLRNGPWVAMFFVTLCHFCVLSFKGAALYNYYHHYADKAAMFDWLQKLGLTAPPGASGSMSGGILETLGYIVHSDGTNLASSNVADVFNSIINIIGTAVPAVVLLLSPVLSRRFGNKAVAVAGFALTAVSTLSLSLLGPADVGGMVALTTLSAICYGPTIPLIWAIYADVADYCEWKTGRRCTGIAFASIGFALKCGLALGSASFLWTMTAFFHYNTQFPDEPLTVYGFRICGGIVVGLLFGLCTVLLTGYKLNKRMTLQMTGELAERRGRVGAAWKQPA
jgi:GPH family glycoside/pentoside/hexuronide:cation symporter